MDMHIGIMHPASHDHSDSCTCQALINELAVKWPELPWTCTSCSRTFSSHAMTLAVVNEKLVKVARSIVGKGRKRLEAAGKGEIRLDDAERAQTKLLMALAEEVLSHPASFACSPCLLMHQAAINATSEVITTFLVDLIGKRDPSTPDKSAS